LKAFLPLSTRKLKNRDSVTVCIRLIRNSAPTEDAQPGIAKSVATLITITDTSPKTTRSMR
jgi:hypothetical protein